ncbi:glycosyltransferase [Desulfobacterota bacterium M19]
MKLAIFEPEGGGHRMVLYVRHIAREALQNGWQLQLFTSQRAIESPAFQLVADECKGRLETLVIPHVDFPSTNPSTINLLKYQYCQFRVFSSAYQQLMSSAMPDFVYLTNLDYCDKIISLLGSPFGNMPFGGLYLAPKFHHRRMRVLSPASRQEWLSEKLFHRLVKVPTMRVLNVIDEPLSDFVSIEKRQGYEKVQYVPDAAFIEGVTSRQEARRFLGIAEGQFAVLVYGALSSRKGVSSLLDAVAVIESSMDVVVILAGKQDAGTQQLLSQHQANHLRKVGSLVELPGFLDDADEYRAFRAADAVWLGYIGFYGMSGVLLQAGRMGLPVIACKQGLIGWLTRKYKLGELVDPRQLQQVVSSIKVLVQNNKVRDAYGENGRRHSQAHLPEVFGRRICDAIGLASATGSVAGSF